MDIDFLSKRKVFLGLSALLLLVSLSSLLLRGLNFGLDFTGGLLVEAAYPQAASPDAVRSQLEDAGHAGAVVQNFGSAREILVRLPPGATATDAQESVLATLRAADPAVEIRRTEVVGPQIGAELAEQGSLALLIALLMILAYVALRFQWKLAVGAVAALLHDVIITVGAFSLLGWTFDLAVLAGLLAVIGYSLNDTIVIFDRARENFRRLRSEEPAAIMNTSLNQSLSRTIVTSFTTLLVLASLLVFGGQALRGFATAMVLGVVIGTYSSVYIAGTVALALKLTGKDLAPAAEKQAELDDLP
jgi:preprotein translocase subunit SecF